MKPEYTIAIGGVSADVIHLSLAPREALYLASRILNQLKLGDVATPIEVTLSGDVKVAA